MALKYNDQTGQYDWDYESDGPVPNDQAPWDPATGQNLAPPPNSEWDPLAGQWKKKQNIGQFQIADTFESPRPAESPKPTTIVAPPAQEPPKPPAPPPTKVDTGNPSSATSQVENRTASPQLDALLAQMLTNQREQAEERARRAEEDRQYRSNIRSGVLGRISAAQRPVDANSPVIRSMARTHAAGAERELNKGREALAARASFQGMPTGAFDSAVQGSYENLAQDTAGYEANLMYQELQNQRAELADAMRLGAGILTADENRDLQRQIAEMDANMDNLRMKGVTYLSGRQQDLNEMLGLGNLGLSRYGLDLNNQQFYDNLGVNIGLQEILMNNAILQQLLGAGA